jgi:putative holliday junction resolvase
VMIGIDYGSRRVGVAVADDETRFARPLEVIDVSLQDPVLRIAQLVDELHAQLIVVGKPVGLSGRSGPAVDAQSEFLGRLREAVDVEIREHDERLTTVVADQGMRAAGLGRQAQKKLRDAVAAQVMLQGFMDSTR